METLTRHSWIHYTVCWIVKLVHGNIDQTLVNSLHGLLNSEIGGLMCHVITTEYRTRVHCIHMYHFAMQWSMWFISWFLVNIFVFNTTVQLGIIPETFFLFFSKNFYLFYNNYSQQVIQSCSLAPILHSGGLLFLLQTNHRTWTSST